MGVIQRKKHHILVDNKNNFILQKKWNQILNYVLFLALMLYFVYLIKLKKKFFFHIFSLTSFFLFNKKIQTTGKNQYKFVYLHIIIK